MSRPSDFRKDGTQVRCGLCHKQFSEWDWNTGFDTWDYKGKDILCRSCSEIIQQPASIERLILGLGLERKKLLNYVMPLARL